MPRQKSERSSVSTSPKTSDLQSDIRILKQIVESTDPHSEPYSVDDLKNAGEDDIRRELDRRARHKYFGWFPGSGKYARSEYLKHMEFLASGDTHIERLFCAANKVGKTETGSFECTAHATGIYPKWWQGKRFDRNINIWVCNKSSKDVKEVNQFSMMGEPGSEGTGMVPGQLIVNTTKKPNVPEGIDVAYVKSAFGSFSRVTYKSYDQGREGFQGRNIDVIWCDEEVPDDIYTECLMRIMTTGGIILCTYTPVMGLTDVTLKFLPGGKLPDKQIPIEFTV